MTVNLDFSKINDCLAYFEKTQKENETEIPSQSAVCVSKKVTKTKLFCNSRKNFKRVWGPDIGMSMEGVAIAASHLKKKHGVEHLFSCKSLEAFQDKLREIAQSKEDLRAAFIVPMFKDVESDQVKEYIGRNEHKSCICVEKLDGKLQIAIIDSIGEEDDVKDICKKLVFAPAKELAEEFFDWDGAALLWYIAHAEIDFDSTAVYYSTVDSQKAPFGCETFSLETGINFLKEPDFFHKIHIESLEMSGEGSNRMCVAMIRQLPPNFMKGAQSSKMLAEYFANNSGPEVDSLRRSAEHTFRKKLFSSEKRNRYISWKSIQNHLVVGKICFLDADKVDRIMQHSLLTSKREPLGNRVPQRLSDRNVGSLHQVTSNLSQCKGDESP